MKLVPKWLDETAKDFWSKHFKTLKLSDEHVEGFAVLCQTYADYRNAPDLSTKKVFLDYYLRLAKEYQLTPKSVKKTTDSVPIKDDLDSFLDEAH